MEDLYLSGPIIIYSFTDGVLFNTPWNCTFHIRILPQVCVFSVIVQDSAYKLLSSVSLCGVLKWLHIIMYPALVQWQKYVWSGAQSAPQISSKQYRLYPPMPTLANPSWLPWELLFSEPLYGFLSASATLPAIVFGRLVLTGNNGQDKCTNGPFIGLLWSASPGGGYTGLL